MMVVPRLNLGGGGSERQTIALANGFAREGCEVTVLLTDKKKFWDDYRIRPIIDNRELWREEKQNRNYVAGQGDQ